MTFARLKKFSYFSLIGFIFPLIGIIISTFLLFKLSKLKENEKTSMHQNLFNFHIKLIILFAIFFLSVFVVDSVLNLIFLFIWIGSFFWAFITLKNLFNQYTEQGGKNVKKISS